MKKWYELVSPNGELLGSPSRVLVEDDAIVDDLRYSLLSLLSLTWWFYYRKAIWNENRQNKLKHFDPSDLVVYKTKDSFATDPSNKLTPGTQLTADFGADESSAVWVVVPAPSAGAIGISEILLFLLIYFQEAEVHRKAVYRANNRI